MAETRYPGYDVLAKRDTPSWNEKTRAVINQRLATPRQPRFFDQTEWAMVQAVAARIVPQPRRQGGHGEGGNGEEVPVAALVDTRLHENHQDGYRNVKLPLPREAWRRGLRALDAEARSAYSVPFAMLEGEQQDALLKKMESGDLHGPAWEGMPSKEFWSHHLLRDVVYAYYSHPTAWSEIGWGGPASPRGYVRLQSDESDPWDAAEAKPGESRERVRKENERVR
jgi:hypothetical protein